MRAGPCQRRPLDYGNAWALPNSQQGAPLGTLPDQPCPGVNPEEQLLRSHAYQRSLAQVQSSWGSLGSSWAGRLAFGPYWLYPEAHSPGAGRLSPKAWGNVCYSLEKEALESSLFDVQKQLAQLEARREQLEADSQALLLAKETLTGTRVWVLGNIWLHTRG